MELGTVVRWLKKVGDTIRAGEPIVEIETDKVSMEVEAEVSGTLLSITHDAGDEVPVIETIGYIGEPGETVSSQISGEQQKVSPAFDAMAASKVPATPNAKRLARELNIDLAFVPGTGDGGAVVSRDVVAATATLRGPAAISVSNTPEAEASVEYTSAPMSTARRRTAERMLESHRTVPAVTLNAEIDVTALIEFRSRLLRETGVKFTINDLILRAVVFSVRDFSQITSRIVNDEIRTYRSVNLGVAVTVGDTLVAPVLPRAEALTLGEQREAVGKIIERARTGNLMPDELHGATFTVTNLGMFDILSFTPLINPPESAILGVGVVRDVAVVSETGAVGNRKRLILSLTIDHRVIDGAAGAKFLGLVREYVAAPLRMVV